MKALIIGAAGFVGGHLIAHLQSEGWEVAATKMPHETCEAPHKVYDLDILDAEAIQRLVNAWQPTAIFHLAAQSSVALSWKEPALTVDVNVKGAVNLLEAVRKASVPPRVLLIGSGEEYGAAKDMPINEDQPLHPGNVYAATKAAQGMLGQIYANAYGLDILVVRAFTHTGPGQSDQFVLSNFCKQVAMIQSGQTPPEMKVGNLEARRDFCDVRDVVRAYRLLIERGQRGVVYNVGSGRALSIQDALDTILTLSETDVTVVQDPARMRPSDTPVIEADITRLSAHTGWQPEIPLKNTLADMLEWWASKGRE